MTTTQPKLLTAADLLRLHSEGIRGELIRGVLCEDMATGEEHSANAMQPISSVPERPRGGF